MRKRKDSRAAIAHPVHKSIVVGSERSGNMTGQQWSSAVKSSLCLLVLLVLSGQVQSSQTEGELDRLVNERLSYMRSVAAYKWINARPIEDVDREARVLESAEIAGLRYGIKREATRAFFVAQIEAAKDIQRYWFARWRQGGAPDKAPDLDREVRPALLQLGDAIMQALADPAGNRTLSFTTTGITEESATALRHAALGATYYESAFDQLLQSGVLRVGTTGDYAPFSWLEDGEYSGIDVDMAKDLANTLDADLVLVATSWPSLVDDLAAGRYDIAMSGVSRTLRRARVGLFSGPYHVGGKTPIARCEDAERYRSLAGIDRQGVHVIVNPGGTNERFVASRISQATVVRHHNNASIFDEIIAGRADVMVTDAIEVRVKTKEYAALCATMPGETLTYQEKGYLMPNDQRLQGYVNLWLAQRKGDGRLEALFNRYLDQ